MKKITPFLWYDRRAEEAARFYVELFRGFGGNNDDTRVLEVKRYSQEAAAGARMPEGTVMTISFVLRGQEFTAINAGPIFKFNESVSFVIDCENQEEVDYFWNNLCADGGEESMCGWCKDKFGLSWQVVPSVLIKLISDQDPAVAGKAMSAMLRMKKIIITDLT